MKALLHSTWLAVGLALGCGGDGEVASVSPSGGQSGTAGVAGAAGAIGGSGSGGAGQGGASGAGMGAAGGAGTAGTGTAGTGTAGTGTAGTGTGGAGTGGAGTAGLGGTAGKGGSGGTAGAGGVAPPTYDIGSAQRTGCVFGAGDPTTKTVGPNVPHGDALPFKHVIVLMLENRSFDHYFSNLPKVGVTDVDTATDADFNYDPTQSPPKKIQRFHETRLCTKDTNHEWSGVHLQYDGGMMSGFVSTNNPGGARAMGYYTEAELPYYYWLAKTFSISDRHFCSLLGPTWPNRFYFYGATSWGNTKTGDLGDIVPFTGVVGKTVLDQLDTANRSWKIYRDGLTSFAIVLKQSPKTFGSPMSAFDADVASGQLPEVVILDPSFSGSGQNDEHPPSNVQGGQALTARVMKTLMSNPAVWKDSVVFVAYDEHGGFYDHVPPPSACQPDNFVPQDFKFDRLGVRTPLMVVSPFAKAGYVSHFTTDLTSITRFIQNRFDLPALTARDANAWPMLDMFDFQKPPFLVPPSGAPSAAPDPAGVKWCKDNPPGTGMP